MLSLALMNVLLVEIMLSISLRAFLKKLKMIEETMIYVTSKETKEVHECTNVSLELEAISFLTSLVPNESCRAIIILDEELRRPSRFWQINRSIMRFNKRQFYMLAVVHAS